MTLFADGCSQVVHAHRAAVELLDHGQQQATVRMVETTLVDIQQVQRHVSHGLGDLALAAHLGVVTHAAQQAVGDARRATGTTGDLVGPLVFDGKAKDVGRAADDGAQILVVVELQALDDTEAVTQRVGQHAGTGSSPHQGEGWQIELDRTGCRAFADHDVELEVLHGRVKHFFDHRRQPVDFVDEQHVVRLEVGQHGCQVAGALENRPRSALHRHAHFMGDDVGQGGLAQAGRAEDQRVVKRFAAAAGGLDEQRHLLAHHRLANVLVQAQRANRTVLDFFAVAATGGDQAVGFDHLEIIPFRLRRISSSLLRPALSLIAAIALLASCGL
ncbi:hypothetical protein D9M71_408770 [compost metagenome]